MSEKVILQKSIAAWLDDTRSRTIPAGETLELTDVLENGRRRAHWAKSTEGMGFVMVDELELRAAI